MMDIYQLGNSLINTMNYKEYTVLHNLSKVYLQRDSKIYFETFTTFTSNSNAVLEETVTDLQISCL